MFYTVEQNIHMVSFQAQWLMGATLNVYVHFTGCPRIQIVSQYFIRRTVL